jgi:hypothetical protein
MIGPPYEPSFVQLFLPLLQNEAIAGTISLRTEEERKCVKEFIGNKINLGLFINIFLSFRSCINDCFIKYLMNFRNCVALFFSKFWFFFCIE